MNYREALETGVRNAVLSEKRHRGCGAGVGAVHQPCPQLPGTILRVFIPAGAVINLLNLFEVTSPSGICFIVRLPFLGGTCGTHDWTSAFDSIRQAGGTVEVVNQ